MFALNNKKKPSLGILITYCDERDLLTRCLRSIKLQTVLVDEVIVFDDNSNFPAKNYIPSDFPLPVRIIHSDKRLGLACARNILLKESVSDFIHFQDSDDILKPRWSETVLRTIYQDDFDFIIANCLSLSPEKELGKINFFLLRKEMAGDDVSFCIRNPIPTEAGVYRRSKVLKIGGFDEEILFSEDYDFHIRLVYSGVRVKFINEPLVFLFVRKEGRTLSNYLQTYLWGAQILNHHLDLLFPKYRSDVSDTLVEFGISIARRGGWAEAKNVFKLAKKIGPPLIP